MKERESAESIYNIIHQFLTGNAGQLHMCNRM